MKHGIQLVSECTRKLLMYQWWFLIMIISKGRKILCFFPWSSVFCSVPYCGKSANLELKISYVVPSNLHNWAYFESVNWETLYKSNRDLWYKDLNVSNSKANTTLAQSGSGADRTQEVPDFMPTEGNLTRHFTYQLAVC